MSSVIPLVAVVQLQLYLSYVPVLWKQLAYIDGIARHPGSRVSYPALPLAGGWMEETCPGCYKQALV